MILDQKLKHQLFSTPLLRSLKSLDSLSSLPNLTKLKGNPEHNWIAYEALKENPVLAMMVINGIVYSIGDWIAQCVEVKPLFEFDTTWLFQAGRVGFVVHGSLSHFYYQLCEALIPWKDWWVVPARIAFDPKVRKQCGTTSILWRWGYCAWSLV